MRTAVFFLSLLFSILVNKSEAQSSKDTLTSNAVARDYIQSVKNTDFKKMRFILSNTALVKVARAGKVITVTRDQLLEDMKDWKGVQQNFEYTYSTICSSDAVSIAKVTLKYPFFTLDEYLIIEKQEERWKITQVVKVYRDPTEIIGQN